MNGGAERIQREGIRGMRSPGVALSNESPAGGITLAGFSKKDRHAQGVMRSPQVNQDQRARIPSSGSSSCGGSYADASCACALKSYGAFSSFRKAWAVRCCRLQVGSHRK